MAHQGEQVVKTGIDFRVWHEALTRLVPTEEGSR